ncbi:hypothetical protein [Phytohabitans suffuscus]
MRRAVALAKHAAKLLPEPPPADDVEGYLAWRDLVLDTAVRISAIVDCRGFEISLSHSKLDGHSPVTWRALLALASALTPPGRIPPHDPTSEARTLARGRTHGPRAFGHRPPIVMSHH